MAQTIVRVPNWLGDAVMSTCALEIYHHHFPHDSLSIVGVPATLPVFENAPYVDALITYDRADHHKGLFGMLRFSRELKQRGFDQAYLLTHSFSSSLLFFLSGIHSRVGYSNLPRDPLLTERVHPKSESHHQARRYADLFALFEEPLRPKIHLTTQEREWAHSFLSNHGLLDDHWIGMAMGAVKGSAKRWPIEYYAELTHLCWNELGKRVVLFGSPNEYALAQELISLSGHYVVNLAGQTTLRQFFALLQACPLLVANDSGAMHVATAVETPLIAIFGPTNPIDTGPLGDESHTLRLALECSPCCKAECPLEHHQCMRDLHSSHVLEKIKEVLAK